MARKGNVWTCCARILPDWCTVDDVHADASMVAHTAGIEGMRATFTNQKTNDKTARVALRCQTIGVGLPDLTCYASWHQAVRGER